MRRLYNWILRKLGIRKPKFKKTTAWKLGTSYVILQPTWQIWVEKE